MTAQGKGTGTIELRLEDYIPEGKAFFSSNEIQALIKTLKSMKQVAEAIVKATKRGTMLQITTDLGSLSGNARARAYSKLTSQVIGIIDHKVKIRPTMELVAHT
ncbi:MAG: hypothetical protein JWL85_749 [Candidatus Saccharibacteria bacterium]|nr:hypothetical protein [Candidatus Saccharibacteria bacterium]